MNNQLSAFSLDDYIASLGKQARNAFLQMGQAPAQDRVRVLHNLAAQLERDKHTILKQNAHDLQLAKAKGIEAQLIDRLELNHDRFTAMVEGVKQVANLPDPIGAVSSQHTRPSGIRVGKMRVPLGVIVMIYESRPNVTIDAAVLNMRVGNAVILRGGSESFHTNMALYASLKAALKATNLPQNLVQVVEDTNRDAVTHLVQMRQYVDLIIPRGSRSLIERIAEISHINILKHLDGNCHIYVDTHANLDMARKLVFNAKTRRYGVCNALESLVVAAPVAETFFTSGIIQELTDKGVELRVCERTLQLVSGNNIIPATEEDWFTEYLGPQLSIKVVDDLAQGIAHINHYGSHHTDAIVTDSLSHADAFVQQVDSSSVLVNASTAFADGFEYGLGAEIGISTDKFHARGPVGLEGLTSEKYVVFGQGEIRA